MDLMQTAISAVIGILGTILGIVISHWLTLRRDRIARKEKRREELRRQIVQGAFKAAEEHARAQNPFGKGGALYFPIREEVDEVDEVLVQELRDLLRLAQNSRSSLGDTIYLVETFFEQLRKYIQSGKLESHLRASDEENK